MKNLGSRIRFGLTVVMVTLTVASFVRPAHAGSLRKPPSPTAAASSAARSTATLSTVKQVFDLRDLPPKTRKLVRRTLATYDFDWALLRPALRAQGGENARIRIRVADTSSWGAVGLSWPPPIDMIEIHSGVRDPWWFRGILLHELAHIVDFYYLSPQGLQDDVAALYGKDWDVVSHSFNDAFTQAFSPFTAKDGTYPLDAGGVLRLRSLLGGTGPLPRKVPPALTFSALGRAPKDTPPASAAEETRS